MLKITTGFIKAINKTTFTDKVLFKQLSTSILSEAVKAQRSNTTDGKHYTSIEYINSTGNFKYNCCFAVRLRTPRITIKL